MPSRYNDKTSRCVWIEDDLYIRAYSLAKDLGYRSFSEFVRDLVWEAVETAELVKVKPAKRRLVERSAPNRVLSRILEKLRRTL